MTGPVPWMIARTRAVARVLRDTGSQALTSILWPLISSRATRRMTANRSWTRCVFLCYGNICRSPYAEAVARASLLDVENRTVDSAGFYGPGRQPPDRAIAVAKERGVDTRSHESRLVTSELLDGADLVVVVEPTHGRRLSKQVPGWNGVILNLADLDPMHGNTRTIADPYAGPPEQFHAAFERIDRCVQRLLELSRR